MTAASAQRPSPAIDYALPPDLAGEEDQFTPLTLDVTKMIQSWRSSLGSVGWFHADGSLRALDELPSARAKKVSAILRAMDDGQAVPHPVCGIGVLESIEIGIGSDVVVAFFYRHIAVIQVLVPKTMQGDFRPFIRAS